MDSILTVVNAASSYDLIDLATVKDELGITDSLQDTKLRRWITATSKRFANICGVVFPEENVSEVFRLHGWGHSHGGPITLRRRPVTFVTTVTEGTTLLTTSGYETDMAAGLIYRLSSNCRIPWCGSSVTVVYSTGYYPIPADVQDAVLAILRHKYATASRDPLLRSFSIENVGSEDYWVPLQQQGPYEALPPDLQPVADTIAHYRDHTIR